jgi:uroporphyrinogen decarboxylase
LIAPERVQSIINHQEADRVPAFESTLTNNKIMKYYGVIPEEGDIDIFRQILDKNDNFYNCYIKSHELFCKIGIDIVTTLSSLYPLEALPNGAGFIDEYGRKMKYEYYKDGTVILGYHGGIFKNFEDYESWERPGPNWQPRIDSFLAGRQIQKDLKDKIFSIPATGALMEDVWQGFGLETFSKILAHSKQAKKIFDDYGKFTFELVNILAENDAKLVLLLDDYGYKNGLFMRPLYYRKYIFPWLKRICDAAHKRDCKIMLHSDGDLLEIFEDIINCGVDAINPIEPTTANPDYNIFKLNKKFGSQITFAGNLSPMMLATGDISEIENYAKRLLKEIAPGGGYIFSSGHSINPAITIDRFEAMQNIRRKYGKYPINIPN